MSLSPSVNSKLLKELAVLLGEQTVLEMARAYIASVEEREAQIAPQANSFYNAYIDNRIPLEYNTTLVDVPRTPQRPRSVRQVPNAPARTRAIVSEISDNYPTQVVSAEPVGGYFQ